VTRRRFYRWAVLHTDLEGGDTKAPLFYSQPRAAFYVRAMRKEDRSRVYGDPVRLSVLLPGVTP
jgi:hypothetical protein